MPFKAHIGRYNQWWVDCKAKLRTTQTTVTYTSGTLKTSMVITGIITAKMKTMKAMTALTIRQLASMLENSKVKDH